MALEVGSRLGHYDVTALIGEGGMGQVYQATDTKLNRQVALKILPEAFAEDPDRLARFQREAQVLASLNHPGIAAIYGIEEADDTRALVLELVEGPTLADRIAQGPIPVDEALPIAKQIAEALEAAHEQGVIHRDLKPANIKVRDDGTVKVLDFGLAKALDTAPEGDPSQSPTLTAAATQIGVIMGTAAYMSPEQARGKPVDRRADIWAFGAILFEMLAGVRAFVADDVSLTVAKVLEREPSVDSLPDRTPPTLRNVLLRCLEKEPRQRIQAIGDVRLAMEGAFDTAVGGSETVAVQAAGLWRSSQFALVAVVMVIITAGWAYIRLNQPTRSVSVQRLAINLPSIAVASSDNQFGGFALSPDGMRLAYVAEVDGARQLYLREMAGLDPQSVPGTERAARPFFSPDGEWIAFFAHDGVGDRDPEGTLKKVSVGGGPPVTLANTPVPHGGSWSSGDTIVFTGAAPDVPGRGVGLFRVHASGGSAERLTASDDADTGEREQHHGPHVLPGGRFALVCIGPLAADGPHRIDVLSLESGELSPLIEGGHNPRYIPTGHLVYQAENTLMAVRFDLEGLALVGSAVPVAEGVQAFDVSDTGLLVYAGGQVGEDHRLVWVDRAGTATQVSDDSRGWHNPRISPDGSQVAVNIGPGLSGDHIWLYDIARGTLERLTDEGDENAYGVWTPDGSRYTFMSRREPGSSGDLYWKPADGSGPVESLLTSDSRKVPGAWSPDGRVLVFYDFDSFPSDRQRDIWTLSVDGTVEPLVATPFNERAPRFSPDGRWFAYVSDRSGETQVYVEPYPGPGPRILISTEGGMAPVWSPDGRELFYFSPQTSLRGRLMAVDVKRDDPFAPGRPRLLFEGPYRSRPTGTQDYDVAPDGQRFLMVQAGEAIESTLDVVVNWHEELNRLVPID